MRRPCRCLGGVGCVGTYVHSKGSTEERQRCSDQPGHKSSDSRKQEAGKQKGERKTRANESKRATPPFLGGHFARFIRSFSCLHEGPPPSPQLKSKRSNKTTQHARPNPIPMVLSGFLLSPRPFSSVDSPLGGAWGFGRGGSVAARARRCGEQKGGGDTRSRQQRTAPARLPFPSLPPACTERTPFPNPNHPTADTRRGHKVLNV
jgi:hypothetical protein